jgi:D-beta-D-heptose 7-phosphate kinase/D-beta-D-heptose 1-phosphate adenosyltransferase
MSFKDLKSNVVWTNGCFDVLHRGHIELFKKCYDVAGPEGVVIVGIDSDERIKQNKGENRPINTVSDRFEMLMSIRYIDNVDIFNSDDDLRRLIRDVYKPDVMIVGDEYGDKEVIGSEFCKYEPMFFAKIGKYSTTDIVGDKKC